MINHTVELKNVTAFTEIVFDGTSDPFNECLKRFQEKNNHLNILAVKPESRAALVFFGHSGLEGGDLVKIPDDWRDLVGDFQWQP